MAVSKVVLGDETLIDLTGDSVSSENLLQGATAHAANGEQITGGVVVTPMYTGTKAAIEEAIALGQIPEDAVVNITDDEETSSFQTQINEINSSLGGLSNSLENIKIYSSEEQLIGTWFDKPLYRKCYEVTNINVNGVQIPHNITNLDDIVKIDGTYWVDNYDLCLPFCISEVSSATFNYGFLIRYRKSTDTLETLGKWGSLGTTYNIDKTSFELLYTKK